MLGYLFQLKNLILILLFSSYKLVAQETSKPTAIITYKTLPRINLFSEEIKVLTNSDDHLTEQVIFEIRNSKQDVIKSKTRKPIKCKEKLPSSSHRSPSSAQCPSSARGF